MDLSNSLIEPIRSNANVVTNSHSEHFLGFTNYSMHDYRQIDHKKSARLGRYVIREYVEEKFNCSFSSVSILVDSRIFEKDLEEAYTNLKKLYELIVTLIMEGKKVEIQIFNAGELVAQYDSSAISLNFNNLNFELTQKLILFIRQLENDLIISNSKATKVKNKNIFTTQLKEFLPDGFIEAELSFSSSLTKKETNSHAMIIFSDKEVAIITQECLRKNYQFKNISFFCKLRSLNS